MPYRRECTLVQSRGGAVCVSGLAEVDAAEGFIVAPFVTDLSHPVVLIPADEVAGYVSATEIDPSTLEHLSKCVLSNSDCADTDPVLKADQSTYRSDFESFHNAILRGEVGKLVLSRTEDVACGGAASALEMFVKACDLYPRMMVALFSTPATGTWLLASPEILIESSVGECHTMALAGTMPYESCDGDSCWSVKNRGEQQYVSDYICAALDGVAKDIKADGPHTVRAGHLAHLRTDFIFKPLAPIGDIISRLHPTPAVCGYPKVEAGAFIREREHTHRSYYAGYCGPWNIRRKVCLFVTLRCMQIFSDKIRLYAGGGIVRESEADSEWAETEQKMMTMRSLIK